MKKFLFLFVLLIFLINCSGVNVSKQLKKEYINDDTVYRINNVKVKLGGRCKGINYPNEEELSKILTQKIKERMCNKIKCLDDDINDKNIDDTKNIIDVNFNLSYRRVFFGEAFFCNNDFGNSIITFNNTITNGDFVIASYKEDKEHFVFLGPIRTILHMAKVLTFTSNTKTEEKYLNAIAKHFSKKMLSALK